MAQARHVGKIVLRVVNECGSVPVARSQCTAAATYWITGGLGALGCETARWLVRRGAKHLVLTGRRPPNAFAVDCIRELESLGVTIRVFQADAGARDRMQFVYDQIQNDMPPLRGVVHAAGAIRRCSAREIRRWKRCQKYCAARPAVLGCSTSSRGASAGLLHPLFGSWHFARCSRSGCLFGRERRTGCAGSCQTPARFARVKCGVGSVGGCWDAAAAPSACATCGGARTSQTSRPRLASHKLEQLLADNATPCAVMPIDWRAFLPTCLRRADRWFFQAVVVGNGTATSSASQKPAVTIVTQLRAMPAGQRRGAHL